MLQSNHVCFEHHHVLAMQYKGFAMQRTQSHYISSLPLEIAGARGLQIRDLELAPVEILRGLCFKAPSYTASAADVSRARHLRLLIDACTVFWSGEHRNCEAFCFRHDRKLPAFFRWMVQMYVLNVNCCRSVLLFPLPQPMNATGSRSLALLQRNCSEGVMLLRFKGGMLKG